MSLSAFIPRKGSEMSLKKPDKSTDSDEVVTIDDFVFKPLSLGNECIEISDGDDDDRSPQKKSTTLESFQNRQASGGWSEIKANAGHNKSNASNTAKAKTMDDIYAKYGVPDDSPQKAGCLDNISKGLNSNSTYMKAMYRLDEKLQQLDRTVSEATKPTPAGKFKFQPSKRKNCTVTSASVVTPVTKPVSSPKKALPPVNVSWASADFSIGTRANGLLSTGDSTVSSTGNSTSLYNSISNGFGSDTVTPITKPSAPSNTSTAAKSSSNTALITKSMATTSISTEAQNGRGLTNSSDDGESSTFGFKTASNIMEKSKSTGGSGFITPATEFIHSITTSSTTFTRKNDSTMLQTASSSRNSLCSEESPSDRRSSFESRLMEYDFFQ